MKKLLNDLYRDFSVEADILLPNRLVYMGGESPGQSVAPDPSKEWMETASPRPDPLTATDIMGANARVLFDQAKEGLKKIAEKTAPFEKAISSDAEARTYIDGLIKDVHFEQNGSDRGASIKIMVEGAKSEIDRAVVHDPQHRTDIISRVSRELAPKIARFNEDLAVIKKADEFLNKNPKDEHTLLAWREARKELARIQNEVDDGPTAAKQREACLSKLNPEDADKLALLRGLEAEEVRLVADYQEKYRILQQYDKKTDPNSYALNKAKFDKVTQELLNVRDGIRALREDRAGTKPLPAIKPVAEAEGQAAKPASAEATAASPEQEGPPAPTVKEKAKEKAPLTPKQMVDATLRLLERGDMKKDIVMIGRIEELVGAQISDPDKFVKEVKRFQKELGVKADGIFGPATYKALKPNQKEFVSKKLSERKQAGESGADAAMPKVPTEAPIVAPKIDPSNVFVMRENQGETDHGVVQNEVVRLLGQGTRSDRAWIQAVDGSRYEVDSASLTPHPAGVSLDANVAKFQAIAQKEAEAQQRAAMTKAAEGAL